MGWNAFNSYKNWRLFINVLCVDFGKSLNFNGITHKDLLEKLNKESNLQPKYSSQALSMAIRRLNFLCEVDIISIKRGSLGRYGRKTIYTIDISKFLQFVCEKYLKANIKVTDEICKDIRVQKLLQIYFIHLETRSPTKIENMNNAIHQWLMGVGQFTHFSQGPILTFDLYCLRYFKKNTPINTFHAMEFAKFSLEEYIETS